MEHIQISIVPAIIIIFIISNIWYIGKITRLARSRRKTKSFFTDHTAVGVAVALEKASADSCLGKCWSILSGNWTPSEQNDRKAISFVHLRSLFDNDTLSGDDTYRRMIYTLPGVFVGLGILGTFIGINEGLGDFDFGNSEAINGSIETLISGMRMAFDTSIWGILASIFFMLILYLLRKLIVVKSVRKFYTFLDSRFEYHSTSRFLADIREQSIAQTNAVKKLKEELVEPLEEALEGAFNNTVVPVMQQVSETVSGLSDFSRGSSTAALEGLVDSFLEKLTSTSNLQLESINEQLKVTSESMTAAREGMEAITDKQIHASNLNSETMQVISSASTTLQDLVGKMQQIKDIADRTDNLIAVLMEASSNHDKTIMEFAARGEKITGDMGLLYQQTSKLWEDHNQSFTKLSNAVEVGVPRFAEEVNRSLGSVLNRFDAELTRAVRSLEGLLEDLQTSFEDMIEKFDEKKVEPSMAVSVNKFAETIHDMSKELQRFRPSSGG